MTDPAERARDEHLVAAMAVVLTSGFAVENKAGTARIERNDDDEFRVLTIEDDGLRPMPERFDEVTEAIRYYLDTCDET